MLLFHDGGPYYIETSPLICSKLQTGFYMIGTSAMKELNVCFTAAFYPAGMYLFKVSNGITGTMCEIYLKLTIKTPERRQ